MMVILIVCLSVGLLLLVLTLRMIAKLWWNITVGTFKILGRILGAFVVICFLIWLVLWFISISGQKAAPTPPAVVKKEVTETIVDKTVHYEWYWKLPPGVYIHGRNESAANERDVEAIPRNDDSIWADLHYVEYGSPETQRIRLTKTGERTWKGSCNQDNPEERATVEVIEISPGYYGGKITWKNGPQGTCYLKRK